MEYEKLLELIKTVSESNITGFQYENGDMKIVITTVESGLAGVGAPSAGGVKAEFAAGPMQGCQEAHKEAGSVKSEEDSGYTSVGMEAVQTVENIVKSPLVGTFYSAPAEDAPPFVQVGDSVKAGQTLAIVEAMKLMNDIEAEYEGTITQIFVKNGDCVEYGQPLFAIG